MATASNGEDAQTLQRADGLWFEDGSIVLQAETTQFRVYHGLLASCSPVFKDMMTLPHPSDSELVEGCPFVLLHDSAAETTLFLRAIFDSSFFPPFPVYADYYTILACLRLGNKYQVDFLRRRALIHLSSITDTQLKRWDRVSGVYSQANSRTPPPSSSLSLDSVASLGREVDALWLLPDAFYNLASRSASGIAEAVLHGDYYGGSFYRLSTQDQSAFFVGHAAQCNAMDDVLEFLSLPADIPECVSPESCARERFKAIGASRERIGTLSSRPLSAWGVCQWDLLKDLCPTCCCALETKHRAARRAFWDNLPGIYDLPSWDELEKMKVAAIGTDWLAPDGC
ncbi:hypothetical protein FB45DRAFT_759926 [Roridomyces roridus]|uniref:BTB domain-containing protein n=1 Tax=Roridomyces roridus TaxID=1738132 RepID=A0AAD7B732_9AGAR|nr:hypothetical protein FB45DRAFT_759926 [Roridomyces roridus]